LGVVNVPRKVPTRLYGPPGGAGGGAGAPAGSCAGVKDPVNAASAPVRGPEETPGKVVAVKEEGKVPVELFAVSVPVKARVPRTRTMGGGCGAGGDGGCDGGGDGAGG